MRTMTAAVLRELPATHLEVTAVPAPVAGRDDDVVIEVEACGICGTDIHIMEGRSYVPDLPFVLGHEPVGTVVDAGAAARHWLGRRVTITLFTGCGACAQCRAGDERLCRNVVSDTGVFGAWGGYATHLLVHAAQLVPVPSGLTSPEAAALVDAGATAANSVRLALGTSPASVLVLGAGPIGHLCAEMLAARGVPVHVVQRSARRRAAVAALGHPTSATIAEAPGPFDVVIDCTGVADVFADGIAALGPGGSYLLAGYARVPEADFGEVSHKEAVIRGIRSGRREDLVHVMDLAASGRIRLPELSCWSLPDIDDALEAVRERTVAKAVVVPGDRGEGVRA